MKKNILVCLMDLVPSVIWEKDAGILMQSIPRQQSKTKCFVKFETCKPPQNKGF